MNYILNSESLSKVVYDNGKPYFSNSDYEDILTSDVTIIDILSPRDAIIVEALYNSGLKRVENSYENGVNIVENNDRETKVSIGNFEGKEEVYEFVESFGYFPTYKDVSTTVNPSEVFKNPYSNTNFEVVDDKHRVYPKVSITLPHRSTKQSAGYDFYSPESFVIEPGETVEIATDVKLHLGYEKSVLLCAVRSSIGTKRKLRLANSMAIIDGDHYNNPVNDGNIVFYVYNYGTTVAHIMEGERFAQGVIVNFLTTTGDTTEVVRQGGGFGSTGA